MTTFVKQHCYLMLLGMFQIKLSKLKGSVQWIGMDYRTPSALSDK